MNSIIVLNTIEINQYADLHDWLIEKLSLPEWYGRNLDALWDCITGYIQLPVTIQWIDNQGNNQEYANLVELLQEAAEEVSGLTFEYLNN